jgi:hypothetical protein
MGRTAAAIIGIAAVVAVALTVAQWEDRDGEQATMLAQVPVMQELLLDSVAKKKLKEAIAAAGKAPSDGEREKISELLMPIANHLAVRYVFRPWQPPPCIFASFISQRAQVTAFYMFLAPVLSRSQQKKSFHCHCSIVASASEASFLVTQILVHRGGGARKGEPHHPWSPSNAACLGKVLLLFFGVLICSATPCHLLLCVFHCHILF